MSMENNLKELKMRKVSRDLDNKLKWQMLCQNKIKRGTMKQKKLKFQFESVTLMNYVVGLKYKS